MDFSDLLRFVLCSCGLAHFFLYSPITAALRRWYLFRCSMCTGFWTGVLISYYMFGFSEKVYLDCIFYGFISLYTTYFLDSILDDNGIKLGKRT